MGRDQYRGRLTIDERRDQLTATLPKPLSPSSRVAQERVLRDIARTWKGELRTNPAWTALNRRVTVHSQGGCPMCICENDGACRCGGVTKPSGEVIGAPGLYVMDAAAFPSAVGVNPSATIAAVAEYKAETFIKDVLGEQRHAAWKAKTSPQPKALDRWIANLKRDYDDDHVLDPLARIEPWESASPSSASLGLGFDETMSGFIEDLTNGSRKRPDGEFDWKSLAGLDDKRDVFERAEETGLDQDNLLTLNVTANIDDLDRFFRTQRQGLAALIGLSGDIRLKQGDAYKLDPEKSALQIFLSTPPLTDKEDRSAKSQENKRRRFFRYRIQASPAREGMDPNSKIWIQGAKILSDQSGFDVWQDLSTLYAEGFDQEPRPGLCPAPIFRGILRLAPLDFFDKQLQTIKITPDDADPARKSWAYGGFVRYFADELASVYLERRGLIKAMVQNLLDPSKGG